MRGYMLATALVLAPCSGFAQAPAQGQYAAPPQGQQAMTRMIYLAAHNQLGVLEYCQGKGSVGADTVALQRRVLGMMPAEQVDGLDEAEAAGKQGQVQFGGNQVLLADAAKSQNTTEDAMCRQIATLLQNQAAQLPK